jgi:hypothetical protein
LVLFSLAIVLENVSVIAEMIDGGIDREYDAVNVDPPYVSYRGKLSRVSSYTTPLGLAAECGAISSFRFLAKQCRPVSSNYIQAGTLLRSVYQGAEAADSPIHAKRNSDLSGNVAQLA